VLVAQNECEKEEKEEKSSGYDNTGFYSTRVNDHDE